MEAVNTRCVGSTQLAQARWNSIWYLVRPIRERRPFAINGQFGSSSRTGRISANTLNTSHGTDKKKKAG